MNRPWIIWSLSALCALFVFGAMALITRHTLHLEQQRAQAEGKAEFEEWVRLALWRMETAAAGLLAEQNALPLSEFREVELKNGALQAGQDVKLRFEEENGVLRSDESNSEWGSFSKRLNDQSGQWVKAEKSYAGGHAGYGDNNLDLLKAVAKENPRVKDANPSWANQVEIAQQQRSQLQQKVAKNSPVVQQNYNRAEKVKRQEIVSKSLGNMAKGNAYRFRKTALSKEKKKDGGAQSILVDDLQQVVPMTSEGGGVLPERGIDQAGLAASGVDRENQREEVVSAELLQPAPLTPVWLEDDLILVREVRDLGGSRLQGVWLNASLIESSLLEDIHDLLPEARLQPVRRGVDVLLGQRSDPDEEDPMVLAALPWRLLPGGVPEASVTGWTPMRKTLGLAWLGAGLAALAAVVLLQGVVKLSERRASFVSSVTHELRTPLTTFSLYSDMLAEGMVQDEEKQQAYLHTLRRESARLSHLVENVLSYSRIERGSARTRVEEVDVRALVQRVEERLSARAQESGMQLELRIAPSVEARRLAVDTTAIEQILFNLVDNAAKYAHGDGCGNLITVSADEAARGKGLSIRVCDQGPGIRPSEQRRLFRAFHKSAHEAAHSKPGVGLGLALSRRLARAIGGDLRVLPQDEGACFELKLNG